jgi:hypothetical protein
LNKIRICQYTRIVAEKSKQAMKKFEEKRPASHRSDLLAGALAMLRVVGEP